MDSLERYFDEVVALVRSLPRNDIRRVIEAIREACEGGQQILIMGNGGSAATATHMACDLSRTAIVSGQRRIRAISLADNVSVLSAWANDVAYEDVFSEQLRNLAQPGDLVVAISGSGRSPNILKAARVAREMGVRTVGFTGCPDSPLQEIVDITVAASAARIEQAEDVHLILEHAISVVLREMAMSRPEPGIRIPLPVS